MELLVQSRVRYMPYMLETFLEVQPSCKDFPPTLSSTQYFLMCFWYLSRLSCQDYLFGLKITNQVGMQWSLFKPYNAWLIDITLGLCSDPQKVLQAQHILKHQGTESNPCSWHIHLWSIWCAPSASSCMDESDLITDSAANQNISINII